MLDATPRHPAGRGPSVVAIGGGTGLSTLLRGLKPALRSGAIGSLTGVVTVSDDGGSSGRLRRDFGIPPPGDIRNCLVALADDEDMLSRLFQYRFPGGDGLSGHSFGNLFMAAVTGITGDFYEAILAAERLLSVCGTVLPATLSDVRLLARGISGKSYTGETAVGACDEHLVELSLDPPSPPAFAPAVAAIREADVIVLGPGSLFTSILPNLLVPEIHRAVRERSGPALLVLNLMTQPGETTGMDGQAHLDAIERQAGSGLIDVVVANSGRATIDRLRNYFDAGATPVSLSPRAARDHGVALIRDDLLADGQLIRHDPARLCQVILGVLEGSPARGRLRAPSTELCTPV